jgi:hypothetical protein
MELEIAGLADAHDDWHKANARCNAKLYKQRELLKSAQVAADEEEKRVFNFEDIELYFQKNGKGTHFLEYEFKPDTPAPVTYTSGKTGLQKFSWCWTHKITFVSVKRFASANGKSTDSGRLSKYLASISEKTHPLAYARAQKILQLNESANVQSPQIEEPERITLTRKELLAQQVCLMSVWPKLSFLNSKPMFVCASPPVFSNR